MSSICARYLLRVDDLCPTMHRDGWLRLRELIEDFNLQPILAVIPDNRDPVLDASPYDGTFWAQMLAMEASGAVIGLHGYRHLCTSGGRSFVDLHRITEFAGVPPETQHEWIRHGLAILRDKGLHPRIWVAPRHGFDRYTLAALQKEQIYLLSDSLARRPFLCSELTWIPQQLWAPLEKKEGVWTVCIHPATVTSEQTRQLRSFLLLHGHLFTSVDELLVEYPPSRLALGEKIQMEFAMRRLKLARARQSFLKGIRSGIARNALLR